MVCTGTMVPLNRCLHRDRVISQSSDETYDMIRGLQAPALDFLEEQQLILVSSVRGHLIDQTTKPSPRLYRLHGKAEDDRWWLWAPSSPPSSEPQLGTVLTQTEFKPLSSYVPQQWGFGNFCLSHSVLCPHARSCSRHTHPTE